MEFSVRNGSRAYREGWKAEREREYVLVVRDGIEYLASSFQSLDLNSLQVFPTVLPTVLEFKRHSFERFVVFIFHHSYNFFSGFPSIIMKYYNQFSEILFLQFLLGISKNMKFQFLLLLFEFLLRIKGICWKIIANTFPGFSEFLESYKNVIGGQFLMEQRYQYIYIKKKTRNELLYCIDINASDAECIMITVRVHV